MKVMVIEIKHCHLKNKIRPYLKDIIKNHKISDTWKIQLRTASNFVSSTDNNEKYVMHSKIDNEEDEVIKDLFDSLKIDIKII